MSMPNKFPLRRIAILLLTALCITLLPGCAGQSRADTVADYSIIPDEIILSFRDSASREQIHTYLSQLDAAVDDTLSDIGIYRLTLPSPLPQAKLEALAAKLQKDAIVEKAHLNTMIHTESASVDDRFYPNDLWEEDAWDITVPEGKNWGLEAIDAPGAWRYLDRMTTVNVGLIEEHVPNHLHPDLKGLFVNRQCLVIDKNGNYDEVDPNTREPDNHSTRVAGIMNAAFHNGEGVSGVMGGKGKLYSYAIEKDEDIKDEILYGGEITGYTYLIALKALIDQDVQVINISMGGTVCCYAASHGNQNAIDYINRQAELATDILSRIIEERTAQGKPDFLMVVAAGNANNDTFYKDENAYLGYRENQNFWESLWDNSYLDRLFPSLDHSVCGGTLAKYSHFLNTIEDSMIKDRVIVVGAVGIDAKNATDRTPQYVSTKFSNLGDRVDLVAPGQKIYGCNANGYGTLGGSGTSFAAPHVSGTAGLVFACDPTLTGPEVKEILLSTATGSYAHGNASSGMVNANLAVEKALGLSEEPVPEPEETYPSYEPETDLFPDTPAEPAESVVVTEVIYPEGSWTEDQKTYFSYLATNAYVDHISNPWIQEACRDQYISNNYTFRDLDFDGTDELILYLGYTGADGEIMVFTLAGGEVCYVGSAPCDGTGTDLFCADHDDEFFLVSFDGDQIYGSICVLSGGGLQIISSFEHDIPFRWDMVKWVGCLPLETREVKLPVDESNSAHGYEEFLQADSYIFFLENHSIFNDWFSDITTADHWVYDIDHDGTKELMVRLGSPQGDNELMVFTRSGHSPIYIGSIPCSNRISLSTGGRHQGFLLVSNDGMLESITRCTVENGSLQVWENYMITDSDWWALAPLF